MWPVTTGKVHFRVRTNSQPWNSTICKGFQGSGNIFQALGNKIFKQHFLHLEYITCCIFTWICNLLLLPTSIQLLLWTFGSRLPQEKNDNSVTEAHGCSQLLSDLQAQLSLLCVLFKPSHIILQDIKEILGFPWHFANLCWILTPHFRWP